MAMIAKNKTARRKMHSSLNAEEELYKLHADMCKVFSHPTRLAILNALLENELSVLDIAERFGASISSTSQHLSLMKERLILETRKVGNQVYYRLANPKMVKAFDLMREIMFEQIQRQSALFIDFCRTGTDRKVFPRLAETKKPGSFEDY